MRVIVPQKPRNPCPAAWSRNRTRNLQSLATCKAAPVAQQGQRLCILIRDDDEQEFLAIVGDIVIDHAGPEYPQGRMIGKKPLRLSKFQALAFPHNLNGHHLVPAAHEIEFSAVALPPGPASPVRRDLPLPSATLERDDVDLWPGDRRDQRHPFSVR